MIGRKYQNQPGGGNKRRPRINPHLRLTLITALAISTIIGLPIGVQAVQNIFTGFGQITDIQFEGSNIDKVIYQGITLWERKPPEAVTGAAIQTVTTATCPTTRTRVYDARDNATYWIQKLADGKCWMLTNLAYGGGGTNTYNDTKTITLNSTSSGGTYTTPQYFIPPGSNRTTGATDPSTSTNGTGQYGYLYNWCAAMGAQTGTSACAQAATPIPNTNISICPSGWRLPTGSGGSPTNEFQDLNNAVSSGSASSPSGLLSSWLGQYSGIWYYNGFGYQGGNGNGRYWASTQRSNDYANGLYLDASSVFPGTDYNAKYFGYAVRCIAV